MLGIGRKIKRTSRKIGKDFLIFARKYFAKKIYSFFLFLSIIKEFKRETNKQKKTDKFSVNLDKINNFEYKVTSQNNEDGIIEHIFSKISNNEYFVELGFDFFECNSLNLIRNGWNGILVDANEDTCLKMENCLKFFYPKSNVKVLNSKINKDNINEIIFSNIMQKRIDFLSIDIDGNDYWVLEKIDTDKVNVICSEYNPWIGNNTRKVIPYNENFTYKDDFYFGASLHSYVSLLESKHFHLIAVDSSGTNAFYVKKEFSEFFEILSATNSFKKASRFSILNITTSEEVFKWENFVQKCKFLDI